MTRLGFGQPREVRPLATKSVRIAAIATALLAGCILAGTGVWQWIQDGSDDPHLVGKDARIVVDGTRDRPVMLAGVGGQLRFYAPDLCLVIDSAVQLGAPKREPQILEAPPTPQQASWFGAVWPHGTTVITENDRFGVRLADGSVYWAGDKVEGGGGFWGEDEGGVTPSFGLSPNCVGHGLSQFIPDPSRAR